MKPSQRERLQAELRTPYRGLRQIVYLVFGASGFLGALLFLGQLATGHDPLESLPNLGLQVGVVALMVWLWRWEGKRRP